MSAKVQHYQGCELLTEAAPLRGVACAVQQALPRALWQSGAQDAAGDGCHCTRSHRGPLCLPPSCPEVCPLLLDEYGHLRRQSSSPAPQASNLARAITLEAHEAQSEQQRGRLHYASWTYIMDAAGASRKAQASFVGQARGFCTSWLMCSGGCRPGAAGWYPEYGKAWEHW